MNIEELNLEYKNKMDALMEEYKDKAKEIAEEEEPFIRKGQNYFTIDDSFKIDWFRYDDDAYDKRYLNCGKIFPYTEETKDKVRKEVELIAKRRRLQSEMEMFARQNNDKFDWSNTNQKKWYLYIDYTENDIREGWTCAIRHFNTTYFTSKKVMLKALDKFGDRIRELYLKQEE